SPSPHGVIEGSARRVVRCPRCPGRLRGTPAEPGAAAAGPARRGGGRPAVIDVREPDEHAQGMIPGTVHIPRGFLELRIERNVPDRDTPVVLYCASGTRSVLAARSLSELGSTNVTSLAAGSTRPKRARPG